MDDLPERRRPEHPVLAHMAAHRSVRRFTADPVADELVRECVAAAQHAATSHWIQAYSCLRVRDPEQRAALEELTGGQAHVRAAPVFLVVCGDQRRHRVAAERAGAAYASNLETFLLAAVDASLFAQNLALALESRGLGICFIGGLRNRLPEVDRLLGVPHGVLPFFGLCAGVPAETPVARPRLPVDAVLHDGAWPGTDEVAEALDAYDASLAPWHAERGRPGYTWSGMLARHFARPAREDLRGYYESKGARFS